MRPARTTPRRCWPRRGSLRLALGVCLALSGLTAWPQASEQQLIKAAFIEKFTRFTDWPTQSSVHDPDKPFELCVAGADPFHGALDELAAITPMKGKRAVVHYGRALDQIDTCNVLFVASSESTRLEAWLARARDRAILTVGDAPGFGERGVMINLYRSDDHVRFEINHGAGRAAGLVLSSRLLSLARLVGEPTP
jgi:hypothetical protein